MFTTRLAGGKGGRNGFEHELRRLGGVVVLDEVIERAGEFDVIHFHIDYMHFPLIRRFGIPGVTTLHGRQDITDLSFTTATITVEQPAGTLVLTVSCTFSSPTTNGAVSSRNVTCTSS